MISDFRYALQRMALQDWIIKIMVYNREPAMIELHKEYFKRYWIIVCWENQVGILYQMLIQTY